MVLPKAVAALALLAEAVVGHSSPVLGVPRADLEQLGDIMMGSYGASLVGIREEVASSGKIRRVHHQSYGKSSGRSAAISVDGLSWLSWE